MVKDGNTTKIFSLEDYDLSGILSDLIPDDWGNEFLVNNQHHIFATKYEPGIFWTALAYDKEILKTIQNFRNIGKLSATLRIYVNLQLEQQNQKIYHQNEDGAWGLIMPTEWVEDWQVAIHSGYNPVVIHDNTLYLKIRNPDISPTYIQDFLNSEPCKKVISARAVITQENGQGKKIETIFAPALATIPIPLTENYFESDVIQNNEIKLHLALEHLSQRRKDLFQPSSKDAFGNEIRELQRLSNLISASIASIEDLRFQIANFFPYPLAYGYRLLSSILNPLEIYREQLRHSENILAFLGSVSIALLEPTIYILILKKPLGQV